ncbi:MAG: hypothetical protein QM635_01305 [Microbacteriaceae bacterium]
MLPRGLVVVRPLALRPLASRVLASLRPVLGGTEQARLEALRARFPGAQVLRSRMEHRLRRSLRGIPHHRLPLPGARLAVVADGGRIAFYGAADAPFCALCWPQVTGVRLRAVSDAVVPDLVSVEGGYRTHLVWLATGGLAVEFEVWGDPERDGTAAQLDGFGLGPVVERLERLRRSASRPR